MATTTESGRWKSAIGDTFNLDDVSRMVARRTGYTYKDVNEVIQVLFEVIEQIYCSGNSVHIGRFKLGNEIKKLKPFYSSMFDTVIPERYSLRPKLFVSKSIADKFKDLSDQLEQNKEWVMLKPEISKKSTAMIEERMKEDG